MRSTEQAAQVAAHKASWKLLFRTLIFNFNLRPRATLAADVQGFLDCADASFHMKSKISAFPSHLRTLL